MTQARQDAVTRIAAMGADDPAEEVREFLAHIRGRIDYWATLPHFDRATGREHTVHDRCEGVAFSILLAIDEALWLVSERGTVLNEGVELHSSLLRPQDDPTPPAR